MVKINFKNGGLIGRTDVIERTEHKPGQKVRPISPNTDAATEKLAVWLLGEFNSMPMKFESSAIKNSIEFVNRTKDVEIAENEMQVSFDVESLFPNIPIDATLKFLRKWLKQNNIETRRIDEYVKLTELCMKENWFSFNGKYYRQEFGCCMGSPLSPFLANLFMSYFETELKNNGNFPRIWYRYVDDVYAIIKKQSLRQFLNRLNNTRYPSIKFTYEEEQEGKLNFLDLNIMRNDGKFEFDIFRKPTNSGRYITSDSYHSFQHKIASFHSMIYRALNIPMNDERFTNEIRRIKEIANINGYTEQLIEDLLIAHKRKKELRDHTSLNTIRDCDDTNQFWSSVCYYPVLTRNIRTTLNTFNIKMSEYSDKKLKHLIGGSKDKINEKQQSGIYSIKCADCDKEYIGQCRRAIAKRYKEHDAHTRRMDVDKSSVARHMIDNNHSTNESNFKMLKRVNKYYELDAFESYFIHNNLTNLMNENDGPIKNSIFAKIQI